MLALCHSSTPYRPHLQLFELPEVSFLVIPNAARWVLHSIIPPPLRLVHPASHPDLSRGRPRASQDLAKTLQAKAGTQGAFMLRCCGIVAAASASSGDETNARFVVAFKWWSLCCPLAEVNRFFCNAEDPDV